MNTTTRPTTTLIRNSDSTAYVGLSCNHTGFLAGTVAEGDRVMCQKCMTGSALKVRTRRVKVVRERFEVMADVAVDEAVAAALVGALVVTPAAPAAPADGGYDTAAANAEWKALKAWRDAGSEGDAPATPNLDAMNAAHAGGRPRTGRTATKAAAAPKATKAAGLRFYVGSRAMPDSQNKLSSVAWQATKGMGADGGRLTTKDLLALLAAAGIDAPLTTEWTLPLETVDVTIAARFDV